MKILKKLRSENVIPFILFLIILINYLPLFKGNFGYESVHVTTKQMAICFAIELLLLAIYLIGRVKITKKLLVNFILLELTTVALLLVQKNNILSGNYELYDLFNIACIFINIKVLFVAFTTVKSKEKCMTWFFAGMVILGLVACAVNIYLYKEQILTMFSNAKQISIKSFFGHRNQFAMYLYAAIISNIMLILRSNNKFIKALLFIPLIILGASIITTSSRTGIASAALFVILFFITTNTIKFINKFIIVYVLTVLLISAFLIGYNYYPEKVTKVEDFVSNVLIREKTIESFTGRDKFWDISKEILEESQTNKYFGVGRFLALRSIEQYHVTQFHNFYVESLMIGGIMELTFFIFIHAYTFIRVIISKIDKKYKLLYLAMYLSMAVYYMFESMSRFSIGCADTICLVFFITVPLLHANTYKDSLDEQDKNKKMNKRKEKISRQNNGRRYAN